MHPGGHHLVADHRLGLGDLVLVVGEDVVLAAGVDVDVLAQGGQGHGRALDVPARVAVPPRRGPLDQPARPGRLPQGEVGVVALARVRLLLPVPGPQLVQGVARQAPVAGERLDREVHVAVDLVGVAALQQLGHQLQHLGDVVGGARVGGGRLEVEGGRVGQVRLGVEGGDLGRRLVLQAGRDQHPVLAAVELLVGHVPDVGDVLHLADLGPARLQGPPEQVGQQEAAQVADVGVAVHGRPAGVHGDPPGRPRPHRLLGPGQGVGDLQHGIEDMPSPPTLRQRDCSGG